MSNKNEPKKVEPITAKFDDDGLVPNSKYPVIIYPKAFNFNDFDKDSGGKYLSDFVKQNNWYLDWGWYIFTFLHYHSTANECLIIFSGKATIQIGGRKFGKDFKVSVGDVVIIPAGVGHERKKASEDFYVFGVYPNGQKWDFISENGQDGGKDIQDKKVREEALENIKNLPLPTKDPVYGKGSLLNLWK